MYAGDTIAAVATPSGPGGIGIVRVSGPLSGAIAARVFTPSGAVASWQSHRLYHGHMIDAAEQVLDAGLAVLMRAPRSYTGEDVLELHCHGSPVLLRYVLAAVLRCGARLAEAGEFTRRAFLNGRLDLPQAEAVLDLVRARSVAGAALATQQLGGRLSEHLGRVRAQLVDLKALLEVQIDFADEEVEITAGQLLSTADTCLVIIQDLIKTFERGLVLRDGLRVTIIGKPNVGKSSLLNALLGEDRAIVTAVAGTTRDTIDEAADFDGVPVVLTDTAGLRDAARADAVERLGIDRTTAKMAEAQVLLKVLDAAASLEDEDVAVLNAARGTQQVVVLNKIDLPVALSEQDVRRLAKGAPIVSVSAIKHHGLAELRRVVARQWLQPEGPPVDIPVLTNVRHRDELEKALRSLALARESIAGGQPADLVAVDVQDAIDHIGAITGLVTSEDVLDRIFSEFCIGK